METGAVVNEFVTIVPVGETKPADKEPAFVTVLTLGAEKGAAEISIRRPKGARLGLGLKFEGGSAASEKVRRLLVQSCAEDSPAANACAPWGKLIPGDEILAIDGVSVSELTRIECVRRLKDSDETLTLLVRHFEVEPITQSDHSIMETLVTKDGNESGRPTMLPPPVPPRKLGKKNSFKDKLTLQTVGEQNALLNLEGQKQVENGKDGGNRQNAPLPASNKLSRKSSFDSHLLRQNKDSFAYLRKGSPEEARRLVRRLSDGKTIPPEAEVYVDLLSNEWERCLILADGESDDTGSSISTVVDRLGSMASSVENSIPSTPVMQPKSIDIQKVLNSIENIDTDLLKDMRNTKFTEKTKNMVEEPKKTVEKITMVNVSSNNEKVTLNKSLTEKNCSINEECSDKNNNTKNVASNRENLERCQNTPNKSDENILLDKPKPMPRNTKIERSSSEKKRRPAPIPEVLTSPLSEPLLTPTKKTCIETWLQHSEAEMNESLKDKIESNPVPEILPRLIDFVPKTQFKESGNENNMQNCARPTVPPPPPPAETREDGSGASLDTIGELDEPSDVTENAAQSSECQTEKSKSYDRSFWNDRVNKSDIEEKSLSNDESPLPTCPRQPPDGVETPSETVEKTPDLPTRLPPSRLSTGWTNTRPRYSYSSRTQDARSEASVKDKIAMFSVESASTDCIDKCSTLPTRSYSTLRKTVTPYKSSYVEVSSLDRRLTKSQDNLDETPRSYKRHTDRPEVLGAPKTKSTNISNKPIPKSNINDKPLFYGSTTNLHSDTSFMRPVYHARSISDDTSKKVSSHKSNLEYLIEQRKKSMSKLRGLVIPEVQTAIVDLPEIKVKDSFTNIYLQNTNYSDIKKQQRSNDNGRINLCENKWKSNLLPNNIPKYSPAFKRKSLQVYTSLSKEPTPERKILDKTELSSKKIGSPITIESMKKPYDCNKSPLYKTTNYILSKDYGKNNLNNISIQDYKNVEIKICTATDIVDSDNDSAMSSTQSSYRSSASSPMYTLDTIESDSSRLSPRISNYSNYSMVKHEVPIKTYVAEKVTNDDFMKRKVCRSMSSDTNISLSSSAGSAATSGSQASCSSLESSVADSDKRRVSKTYNVDTINRRNILASAKCRSGRDAKLESPVLETKFSHESYNRSPSPINKTSECLSTLTSSVSAIANKGENRRRNKFILESDSDTDSEKNMRLRKSEYKNTRLKRNSSASKKQNEVVYENGKGEQNSSYDKEEKVKDVKKIVTNEKSQTNENTNKIVNNRQEVEEVYKGKTLLHRTNELITTKPILNGNSQANTKVDMKLSTINTTPQNVFTQTYRLRKGSATGVGLILAGGTDCEAKDVTVHRVLVDGIAAKAGIRRGSKVRSINGNLMSGLTHAQSVSILKEQRAEVVIEIENGSLDKDSNTDGGSEDAESKGVDAANGVKQDAKSSRSLVTVLLEKIGGGAGLGFGLDGGRDSPQGDKPLTIKKLFAGGAAAQSGRVTVGAELLSAGGQSMEGYTRTQAWAALKALPPGQVELVLRNPSNSNGEK